MRTTPIPVTLGTVEARQKLGEGEGVGGELPSGGGAGNTQSSSMPTVCYFLRNRGATLFEKPPCQRQRALLKSTAVRPHLLRIVVEPRRGYLHMEFFV